MTRTDDEQKVVAFRRWHDGGPGDDVIVVVSFAHESREDYRIGFPQTGRWALRLNTDWKGYSNDFGDFASHDADAVAEPLDGIEAAADISIGAYSVLVFSRDR